MLVLGDLQYECGGYEAFLTSYDASWGRLKAITHPVPGNHEYNSEAESESGTDCSTTTDAAGYYEYFGAAAGDPSEGWYSYDVGAWHVIALNSNCNKLGGCGGHSPQGEWLAADLAADDARCTLAYMHYPRFSSGQHGNSSSLDVLWELMDRRGRRPRAERARPRLRAVRPSRRHPAARPPRASGRSSWAPAARASASSPRRQPGSEVRIADTLGVLRLALGPTSFGWRFLPVSGGPPLDEGTGACH